jgi:hypothetical protein
MLGINLVAYGVYMLILQYMLCGEPRSREKHIEGRIWHGLFLVV